MVKGLISVITAARQTTSKFTDLNQLPIYYAPGFCGSGQGLLLDVWDLNWEGGGWGWLGGWGLELSGSCFTGLSGTWTAGTNDKTTCPLASS